MDGFKIGQAIAGAITELAKTFALFLAEKVGKTIKDKNAQNEILFQTAYEDYLNATFEKNINIKTLLYKQAPQNLYDFYECLGIKNEKLIIDTSDINNLLEVGHKLLITGTGGIGKTIMMKHLFLSCIEKTDCIPILIELRGLNEDASGKIDIIQAIYDNLKMYNFPLAKEYFDYSLSIGKYVFIFDGFDEVNSKLVKKVADSIFYLSNKYSDNYFIVSSRPMSGNFVSWSNFIEFEAQSLSKEQALDLIKRLNYDEQIKNKFYEALNDGLYEKYVTFASNPLLLTIMLMTFAEGGEIPENFNDFYEQAFVALYKAHDASKGAYVRDKAANLGQNDFKLIFSYVCFKSFFAGEYQFNESNILSLIEQAKIKHKTIENFKSDDFLKDLTDSVCLIIRDGLHLRFAHRSFQEYFAAYYTTQLEDTVQEQIIKFWLKEYAFFSSSEFLNILRHMQPERFRKNILLVGLKEIEESINGLDEAGILQLLSKRLFLANEKDIKFIVSNRYFVGIYEILKEYFNEDNGLDDSIETDIKLYNELVKKGYINKDNPKHEISIKSIIKDEVIKALLIEKGRDFFDTLYRGLNMLDEEKEDLKDVDKLSTLLDSI